MNAWHEVQRVLGVYFDTLYHCDLGAFDEVFHPQALYATADEVPPLFRDMPSYRAVLAQRQSPASRDEVRNDHIDAIEFAGENTAFARVRCRIAERDFVDFLTLVRTGGRWQIVAKVFQVVSPQGEPHALR
ncbi:nuclear transport factor 2 family protein [Chitinibacteraceae bacterium HSL-7]